MPIADLHVLLVEDDPLDAELVVHELEKSGYDPKWRRVDTQAEFMHRLAHDPPDIIISDHAMPQFSSVVALQCLHNSGLKIPFIVVSHAIGEEEAVQLIRNGADDFLMKDRLGRLGEAVRQALEQQRLRTQHAADQQALSSLNADLERRVVERTAELQAATIRLEAGLDQRKQAEQVLQRLNAELEERVEKRTRDVVASHHRLRALASELTLAEQRERKRLADELHDHLAQMLALGRMKIAQLSPKLASVASAVTEPVREIDDLFKNALIFTRSLMAKLSPPVLNELGLPAALRWLADQMPLHGLTVDVRLTHDTLPLPDDQAMLIFQSVRELLINVAKHAGTDRATVALNVDDQQRLSIEVLDAGRGFDITALENKPAGEHFGLCSVRERMEVMGGALQMNSTVGHGTTATLILPLGKASVAECLVVNDECSMTERPDAKIRVLLVDDHVLVRQGFRALLEGYPEMSVIGEAGDGEECVALAAQLAPNMVLMDINMPWMDGVEATKRIKQEWPGIPVIGLSVNNSAQAIDAMNKAGAVAFVSKGVAGEQLYDAIVAAMAIEAPRTQQAGVVILPREERVTGSMHEPR